MVTSEQITEWHNRIAGYDDPDTDEYIDGLPHDQTDFKCIPENRRLHSIRDLCGLMYYADRMKFDGDIISCAEHDQVWLNGPDDAYDGECWPFMYEDVLYLNRCGIWWDDDVQSFSMWV